MQKNKTKNCAKLTKKEKTKNKKQYQDYFDFSKKNLLFIKITVENGSK